MALTPVVKAGYWYCNSQFPVANIDSSLFTHLFAAFADVNPSSYEVTFPTGHAQQFQRFTGLVQAKNPHVKTLLAIGGEGCNPSIFASMTGDARNRQAFIDSSLALARKNHFDGLCLCWQYPSKSEEMNNLGEFLAQWREKAGDQLLLTAAVFYSSVSGNATYPIPQIIDCLDWINLISYDIYTPASSFHSTGPPAALYNPISPQSCVNAGVHAWLDAGVPAKKLVLGLEFHGRCWILVRADNKGLFAPARGPDVSDPIAYRTIVNLNSQPTYAPTYVTAYFSDGVKWVGYDDAEIISQKVEYAKETKDSLQDGLLGYVAWHVADDTATWTLSRKAFDKWGIAN